VFCRYLRDALAHFFEFWFPAAIAAIRAAEKARETVFSRLTAQRPGDGISAAGEVSFCRVLQLIYKPRQDKKAFFRKTFPQNFSANHTRPPSPLPPAQSQRGRESRFMLWGCQGLTKNPRRQTSPVAPGRSAALPGQSPLAAEVYWAPSCQAIKRVDYRGAFFLSQFVAGAGGDETVRSSFQV